MHGQLNDTGPATATANDEALRRVIATRPRWDGVVKIGDVAPQKSPCLFHAGPAYDSAEVIPAPVRNSLAFGCLYEGWAKSWDEAEALIAAGAVAVEPAQDHGLLVPLAGVASPSMAAVRISDPASGRARYCVLNEGADIATRLGRRDERLMDQHRWLNGELADWLTGCLAEPLDVLPLMLESFSHGDDGHAQTSAGSGLIASALRRRAFDTPGRVSEFLNGAAAFALNIWMASIALKSSAAEGVEGSSLVSRAGGNGVTFGYVLAGEPGRWKISDALKPVGTVDPRFAGSGPTGALGDSAVIDFFGLGGMNLATAPVLAANLAAYLPDDALQRGAAILGGKHPGLGGRLVGCLADRAAKAGKGPIILLGMIDERGEAGRLGGGVVDVPGCVFQTT
ncbi:DUF1116 domain-containing protein [Hyphomicrobium sp. 99]|uniref:oxamate carbamoyltransferase subunit AllG family protein n=1 Tax=Hyphomicrobium sp. 99 TaxID=1163419 RepID=UPI000698C3A9|nr:DUF1116 domain-containing protein [Hyphomicrobium sp. 99]